MSDVETTALRPEVASSYVRKTVDRCTEVTRRPEQDYSTWDIVHLLSIISWLDVRGHGDLVREAADAQAASYDIPTQAEYDDWKKQPTAKQGGVDR